MAFCLINYNSLCLVYAQFNSSICPSNVASATSNIVTVTVDSNTAPTVSFTSGYANDTMCDGDTVVFDAAEPQEPISSNSLSMD